MKDSVIYYPSKEVIDGYNYNEKVAVFDFDGTLVKPKDNRRFPKDADDWTYTQPSVPGRIRKFSAKGYRIVILTDQTKEWKIEQIKKVVSDLNVPVTAIIGGKTHKPETTLFEREIKHFNKKDSFYVGDAAGRPDDWSDVDIKFAQAAGISFIIPENMFEPTISYPTKIPEPLSSQQREVVIMVGYPGSGKSTLAKHLEDTGAYYRVDGDVLKTPIAMIKDAQKQMDKSIIFDSTGGTKKKREIFLRFAELYGLPARILWAAMRMEEAMMSVKKRTHETGSKRIPNIAFYAMRKRFEVPTDEEAPVEIF
jgi:bifunctional polynucleotide phosphatase/kinase